MPVHHPTDETDRSDEQGFTLIELLVVVIIIGILSAIAVPLYHAQQQRAREAAVQSEVRTMSHEVQMWLTEGVSANDLVIGLAEDASGPYWFLWKLKPSATPSSPYWGSVTRLSRASDDVVPASPSGAPLTSPLNIDDGTGTLTTLQPVAFTVPVGLPGDGSTGAVTAENWCLAVTLDPDGDARPVRYSARSGVEWDKSCTTA